MKLDNYLMISCRLRRPGGEGEWQEAVITTYNPAVIFLSLKKRI